VKITVLGCGTSTGVPIIGCPCAVCTSDNEKNKRYRSSVYIEIDKTKILIDTTPDFRSQALENSIKIIDAVLYTHPHSDHLNGIDELRIFNFWKQGAINIYSYKEHLDEIKKRFSYIFDDGKITGGGKPMLVPNIVDDKVFKINEIEIIPVKLYHGDMRNMGVRINNFAYLTDCNSIPDESYKLMENLDVLIIDALRFRKHPTHFSLQEALEEIDKIKPKFAYLTHMTHDFDYEELLKQLPVGVEPAYDGLEIKL